MQDAPVLNQYPTHFKFKEARLKRYEGFGGFEHTAMGSVGGKGFSVAAKEDLCSGRSGC